MEMTSKNSPVLWLPQRNIYNFIIPQKILISLNPTPPPPPPKKKKKKKKNIEIQNFEP